MLIENADGERLDLAERDCLEPARPFETQIKATDASEQRKDFEGRAAHLCPTTADVMNTASANSAG
jgi:hypothetical protein